MTKIIKGFVVSILFATLGFASGDLNIIPLKKVQSIYEAKSALFMDARGFKLYQKGTIMGAIHMPNKKFEKFSKWLPADKGAKIVSFCNGYKCEESDFLAKKLIALGYTNVMVYKGGYPEWKEKKLPLMSLVKECKEAPKGVYVPKKERAITINNANVYWGGEEIEDGMIDQFWFETVILSKLPANIQLVDVRKASQFKEGHIKGAINIPFADEKLDYTKFPKNKLIVFYCNTGMMSTDSRNSLPEDVAKNTLIFDANIKCENGKCTVEANEDL